MGKAHYVFGTTVVGASKVYPYSMQREDMSSSWGRLPRRVFVYWSNSAISLGHLDVFLYLIRIQYCIFVYYSTVSIQRCVLNGRKAINMMKNTMRQTHPWMNAVWLSG